MSQSALRTVYVLFHHAKRQLSSSDLTCCVTVEIIVLIRKTEPSSFAYSKSALCLVCHMFYRNFYFCFLKGLLTELGQ